MQVTFSPLQLVSRIVAVIVVALPLAGLRLAIDDYERQAIANMNREELVDFVKQIHASGFLSAYALAAVTTLMLVLFIEAIAFGIRIGVGSITSQQSSQSNDGWLGVGLGQDGLGGFMHQSER